MDELAELDEKIRALKTRRESLELRRGVVEAKLVEYSDAMGFMSLTGHTHKALVRHERKIEFPEDKTELVNHLKDIGAYDGYSMVNYPRLRSDVAKGLVDPGTARLAKVTGIDKVYLRKRLDRRGLRIVVFEPEAPAPAVGLFEPSPVFGMRRTRLLEARIGIHRLQQAGRHGVAPTVRHHIVYRRPSQRRRRIRPVQAA